LGPRDAREHGVHGSLADLAARLTNRGQRHRQLESIVRWSPLRIREFFEGHGFVLREWDKVRTDSLTFCRVPDAVSAAAGRPAKVA